MHSLYEILAELDSAKIHYSLARYRDDAVTIHMTVVGKRIEVDVESDGSVSTAQFSGNEDLQLGIEVVRKIVEENSEENAQ